MKKDKVIEGLCFLCGALGIVITIVCIGYVISNLIMIIADLNIHGIEWVAEHYE